MAYSSAFTNNGQIDNRNNFLYWYRNNTNVVRDLPSRFLGACGQYSIPVFCSAQRFGFFMNLTEAETTATYANLVMAAVDKDLTIVKDNLLNLQQDATPTTGYRIWGYTASLSIGLAADILATKYFVIYDSVSGDIVWRSNELRILTIDDAIAEGYVQFYYRNSVKRFGFNYDEVLSNEANFYNTVYLKVHHLKDELPSDLSIYEEASTGNERVHGSQMSRVLVFRGGKWDRKFHEAMNIALGTSDELLIFGVRYVFDGATGYDPNQSESSVLSYSNFNFFEYDYQITDKT